MDTEKFIALNALLDKIEKIKAELTVCPKNKVLQVYSRTDFDRIESSVESIRTVGLAQLESAITNIKAEIQTLIDGE